MSSSSSTSSSNAPEVSGPVVLNTLEKLPGSRKLPWAAMVLVVLVVIVECTLYFSRDWFADRAAWQWEVKKKMLAQGQLKGDIAIMGTSVLFHGIDPARINELTGHQKHVVNLALNGMQIHHITQTFEDQLEKGNRYEHVLLELRDLELDRESWIGGPYWRHWASWSDLGQSGIPIHEPSLVIPFTANRLLTSFNYRRGIDNWLVASAKSRSIWPAYRQRNHQVKAFMVSHLGYSEGEFGSSIADKPIPEPVDRPWAPEARGLYWFEKMLEVCETNHVKLTLLVPPAPPFVVKDRAASHYDESLDAFIDSAKARHPALELSVLRITGYTLADFADDHHYSPQGKDKLTADVAQWVEKISR